MSINRVTISGNLGRDPELRSTASGMQVLSFSVCVNTLVKRGDEWQDKPNWVDVAIFGQRAESVSRFLKKGSHVTVAGRLNQNSWETKDGQKRSKLEVIVDEIEFMNSRPVASPAAAVDGGQQYAVPEAPAVEVADEGIPF